MVDRPVLRGVRWAAPVARGIRPCSEVIANTPSWQEGAGLLDLARQLSAARNADACACRVHFREIAGGIAALARQLLTEACKPYRKEAS